MSWRHRLPRDDDRTHRRRESCGKGHKLDPLLDNACKDGHSVGSDPNKMIQWGKDIETKWLSVRSTTPIRSKGEKKTCVTSCYQNVKNKRQSPCRGRGSVVIIDIPCGVLLKSSPSCPAPHPNWPIV